MTVEQAILAGGGRIVYSTTVSSEPRDHDDYGIARTKARCGKCGLVGHTATRCNGKGNAPRPLYRELQFRQRAEAKAAGIAPAPRACSRCGATDHDARKHNGRRAQPEPT